MSEKGQIPRPTVSAMMPAYNASQHIEQAIEGILNQTYQDWELIVVDDGSTDDTPTILAEYARRDARIKAYRIEHGGRGRARNECIKHSSGKYIAVCDSDDLSLPDRFAKQIQLLDDHPEVGVVACSRVICIDDASNEIFEVTAPETDEAIHRKLDSNRMPILNTSAMISAELFTNYGNYDEELLRAQDYEFFKRIHRYTNFETIPEPLVMYRTSGLVVSPRYLFESEMFMYYATYRAAGGTASFEEFYRGWNPRLYRRFVVPAKYLWYLTKRKVLRLGVTGAKDRSLFRRGRDV